MAATSLPLDILREILVYLPVWRVFQYDFTDSIRGDFAVSFFLTNFPSGWLYAVAFSIKPIYGDL
jgi:hypothetical protein